MIRTGKWKVLVPFESFPFKLPFKLPFQASASAPSREYTQDSIQIGRLLKFGLWITTLTLAVSGVLVSIEKHVWKKFADIWNVFDTGHYVDLATQGYQTDPDHIHQIVFYPFFPLLMKLGKFLFHDPVISGLVIANLCFFFCLVSFYQLLRLDFPRTTSFKAVLLFAVFPTAYFLHAAYSESLFILLVLASFYWARSEKWAWAGIAGLLAAMTRTPGFCLIPALLVEYLHQKDFQFKRIRSDIVWIFFIGVGTLLYLCLNQKVLGNAFAFLGYQDQVWGREIAYSPLHGLFQGIAVLQALELSTELNVLVILELCFTLFAYAALIEVRRMVRPSYFVYALCSLLLLCTSSIWLSMPRLILPIFPIFIWLGKISKKPSTFALVVFVSASLYGFLFYRFINGLWAF